MEDANGIHPLPGLDGITFTTSRRSVLGGEIDVVPTKVGESYVPVEK